MPLYNEPVIIVTPKKSIINTVYDLAGKTVCIGPPGSGMGKTSQSILTFYGIDCTNIHKSFTEEGFDAAIVTTGILNKSLIEKLQTGRYKVIGVSESEALATTSAHLADYILPKAVYHRIPSIPQSPVKTVTATAMLTTRDDISPILANTVLRAINETDLISQFPPLYTPNQIRQWDRFPLHPYAQQYYNPYERIGLFANWMASLAATKELIFALLAAGYFLWLQLRRLRRQKHEEHLVIMKERLDTFLERATHIDRQQLATADIEQLETLIDEVTSLKLEALQELTSEELYADNLFSIFLMQCTSIISKIQAKASRNLARNSHLNASSENNTEKEDDPEEPFKDSK